MTRRSVLLGGLLVASLVAAACSPAPRPGGDNAMGGDDDVQLTAGGGDGTSTTVVGEGGTADGGEGGMGVGGAGGPGTRGGAGGRAAVGGSGGAGAGGGSGPGPGGGTGTGGGGGGGGGAGFRDANLWSGAANTEGISADTIKLCAHAALIFAQAFDTRPEDLNVYWQQVNDNGGIHGRKVEISYEDDQYSPDEAKRAADRCGAKNPFMLLGGIGFDQIPNVRGWAEEHKMLYFHHIAVADDKQYSFTPLPTVTEVGRAFGEHIAARHGTKKVGIVYRASEHWGPGRDAGKAVLQQRGVNVVADLPVQRNQSVYSQEILALKDKADVVWLWENALAAAEFIKQSHNQGYSPTFVVFPFQTTLDVLGEDSFKSRIEGVATWPAYKTGGYGNDWAQFGLGQEIQAFEAAMNTYRRGVKTNDILWQVWLSNKLLHDMFERCGRDCTRNRMAGLMLSGYRATIHPNCEVNFARHPHRGGYHFIAHEAFDAGNRTPYYRTTAWCSERLG